MKRFIASNPGLESRFANYLYFDDYTPDELLMIFASLCKASDYELSVDGEEKLKSLFERAYGERGTSFSNARFVRNLFEKVLSNQASRVINIESPDRKELLEICADDIP
jgi:hypothetical protein